MKEVTKVVGWFFLAVVVMLGISFVAQGGNWFMYKFYAPKYESVRRETFEQTKSYKQGTIQNLRNEQVAYIQADVEHKKALRSVILHEVADFPDQELPLDLRNFVDTLRSEQLAGK